MSMVKKLAIILLFALIASPFLFKTVAGLAGSWVASNSGSPTPAGLLLHGLVFVILSGIVWKALGGRKSRYADEMYGEEMYADEAYGDEPYGEEPYGEEPYGEEPYGEEMYAEDAYAEEAYAEEAYAEEPYEADMMGMEMINSPHRTLSRHFARVLSSLRLSFQKN